jgi:two-component system cell cycle sensor histidine kinase/response regulator CckA
MCIESVYEAVEKIAESLKKPKILVMDDDESVRNVVGLMLYKLGYDVSLSKNGTEAIVQYKNSKASGVAFDVVILDLAVREGMGGKQACRILLETDSSANCIAACDYLYDPVMTEFERYGFKGAIAKPFSINCLSEVLEAITGNIR